MRSETEKRGKEEERRGGHKKGNYNYKATNNTFVQAQDRYASYIGRFFTQVFSQGSGQATCVSCVEVGH